MITALVYLMSKALGHVTLVVVLLILGAILEALLVLSPRWRMVEYVPFICLLMAGALFTKSGADELYAIFSKMNMDGLSSSWISSGVLLLVTLILSGLVTVLYPHKDR